MPALVLDEVSHQFGHHHVIDHVTLRVEQGDTVALMAPSGAGKTTLLAIAGGLISPTSGRAYIEDTDQTQHVPRRWCSWIFQTTNSFSRRSVIDNAALGALALGESHAGARQRALDALDKVDLLARSHALARELSGGELQRLSIARALASGQPFLIADEPTGQLDQRTARNVVDAMFDALHGHLLGLIVATHDPMVANRCATTLKLENGRIVGS